MSPESRDFLAQAQVDLKEAKQVLAINLARVAARCAYYAAFHAAEALVFAKSGRVAKTHSGVRQAFALIARDDPGLGPAMTAFLAHAYDYKEIADYHTRPGQPITAQDAAEAIEGAEDFLARVVAALS